VISRKTWSQIWRKDSPLNFLGFFDSWLLLAQKVLVPQLKCFSSKKLGFFLFGGSPVQGIHFNIFDQPVKKETPSTEYGTIIAASEFATISHLVQNDTVWKFLASPTDLGADPYDYLTFFKSFPSYMDKKGVLFFNLICALQDGQVRSLSGSKIRFMHGDPSLGESRWKRIAANPYTSPNFGPKQEELIYSFPQLKLMIAKNEVIAITLSCIDDPTQPPILRTIIGYDVSSIEGRFEQENVLLILPSGDYISLNYDSLFYYRDPTTKYFYRWSST